MPVAESAALIAGIASAAASGANTYSQGKSNKKTRQLIQKQHSLDRKYALEDWHRTNAYNDPQQQVARLKAAGLNPALLYGSSSGGASGTAGSVQKTTANYTDQPAPQYGAPLASIIPTMVTLADLEMKDAQTDNIRTQGELLEEEKIIKKITGETNRFDLSQKERMADTSFDYQKELLREKKNQIDIATKKDIRDALQAGVTYQKILGEIKQQALARAKTKQETKEIGQRIDINTITKQVRQLELELAQMGITKGSPWYVRAMGTVIGNVTDGLYSKSLNWLKN